jgi:hypothetical protein
MGDADGAEPALPAEQIGYSASSARAATTKRDGDRRPL